MLDYFEDDEFVAEFKTKLNSYSDGEIIKILQKRDHYNKTAAQLAIDEAIKRGLIHSEQDLLHEKYRVQPMKGQLFPKVDKLELKVKIIKSLARSFVLVGALPLVFGILGILKGEVLESVIILLLGIIWISLALSLMKKKTGQFLQVLIILAFGSLLYMINYLLKVNGLQILDVVFTSIFYLLLFYGLFFAQSLVAGISEKNRDDGSEQ